MTPAGAAFEFSQDQVFTGFDVMSGRSNQSVAFKIRNGEKNADRVNLDVPTPEPGDPNPPPDLSPEAADEWDRVTNELRDMGVLSGSDRAVLWAYSGTWQRVLDADRAVKTHGILIQRGSQMVKNPAQTIFENGIKELRALLRELGLTPASRNGVNAIKPKVDSVLAQFIS